MKKFSVLLFVFVVIAVSLMSMKERTKDLRETVLKVGKLYAQQAETLDSFLQTYPSYFYDSSYTLRQKKYEELAYYFKRASGFILYFEPELYYSRLVGPFQFKRGEKSETLFDVIPDNWLFVGPIGNEHDTSLVKNYSKKDSIDQKDFITRAVSGYRKALKDCRYVEHLSGMNESMLFDALRTEIFRISTIDIGNSDLIIESAGLSSLNGGIESWLLFTSELVKDLPASRSALQKEWDILSKGTLQFLVKNKDFRSFDRMFFIKNNLIPLSQFLNDLQLALKVPYIKRNSPIRAGAKHIYDKNIFDPDYFSPDKNGYYSADKAKLGELLFFDPILSDNNKRACASCHKPEMAFTDGRTKSMSFDLELLPRNSPTVINSGFQKKLFWDQRASSLEDQLDSVVNNAAELHSSFEHVIGKINASPEYVRLFNNAFPSTKKNGITRKDVKNAIGVYERTVTGLNSRFDQYMQGDETKLSPEEINGFNVYMGKGKCGVCHTAPLFNGALPPFYDLTDHKSLGVPIRDTMSKYVIDPDPGMMKATGEIFTKFSFKTPTVRNAAVTAPYMHNGVYKTLEQVVDFYDHAGGNKFAGDMRSDTKGLPFFTLIPLELKLTPGEKKDLVAFMRALTDTTASGRIPSRLPDLTGTYIKLNKRVIGGEY